ncbi:hypothetical protein Y1Q_0011467 [Alligator mississippiensis]|uniref:Uncharacterized protein n=1 Tax=Alligator mississippiensis TaxID=8496 RepID=A0A151LZW0_ALLMI|nr:hypothetical protein Y1Q_0011467 [Alligator mississippiensis]
MPGTGTQNSSHYGSLTIQSYLKVSRIHNSALELLAIIHVTRHCYLEAALVDPWPRSDQAAHKGDLECGDTERV